jgi:hypothetical protein
MEQLVECVIVGGPQHGLVSRQFWDSQSPMPLALVTDDGEVCVAAASRRPGAAGDRIILLHPAATGQQLTGMLTGLNRHIASVCAAVSVVKRKPRQPEASGSIRLAA